MGVKIAAALIGTLLSSVDKETAKEACDAMLDKIEDKIAATPTKWDDIVIRPMVNLIRRTFDIPDGDD